MNKDDSLLDFSQGGELITHPPEEFSQGEDIDEEMDKLIKEVRSAELKERQ